MIESRGRASRERRYWDAAYAADSGERSKIDWTGEVAGHGYGATLFYRALDDLRGRRVLTLGAGIDRVALWLASRGNEVLSTDISWRAAKETAGLASSLASRDLDRGTVRVAVMDAAAPALRQRFDAVVCKRSLHHMDIDRVLGAVSSALAEGGRFVAEEPVCLLRALRWFHGAVPYHPHGPRTPDEAELAPRDLARIEAAFASVSFVFLDCFGRESVASLLGRRVARHLLPTIGRLEQPLLNGRVPVLRPLSTYVLITATK